MYVCMCLDDWHNDIALVKLDEPVPASEDELPEIQNVFLPDQGETEFPEALQECVMKGWGCTEGGQYVLPLGMKGCICHFVKWQIHPFIYKGTVYHHIGVDLYAYI